jgi:hypothetical protein
VSSFGRNDILLCAEGGQRQQQQQQQIPDGMTNKGTGNGNGKGVA